MDASYGIYCLADPVFYESPVVPAGPAGFDKGGRGAPDGWVGSDVGDWLMYYPTGVRLPAQGWKIHVSACLRNAGDVFSVVYDYCVPRRIPFKFIRNKDLLFLRNSKYADRTGSGKFVTIYPTDEVQFEVVLNELGRLLEGQEGPYILSDLRWGPGPLYVRYGGFAERWCPGPDGELELAIADPDGNLVPDERRPTFRPPAWVKLPDFLSPHLEARNQVSMEGLPYRIESALHFSNGGGVYKGVDTRSGEQVVLKEARPHAGLAFGGADAVRRLRGERDVLERLAGLGVVPSLRDYLVVGDHEFLVEGFVEGRGLYSRIVERYPLTAQESDEAALAEYTAWALDAHARLERAVAAIHDRGIVIADLHPSNVLVRPDGDVVIIDLEIAGDVRDRPRQTLADPAFLAPPDRSGFDLDLYALACLRLFLFFPLTALLGIDRGKAVDLADAIGETFPVPRDFLADAVSCIVGPPPHSTGSPRAGPSRLLLDASPAGWERTRASMAAAIRASATPARDDRLFPGDPRQFATGGLNVAYGAAGVLYALAVTGAGHEPEHEEWLVERAMNPQPGTRLGFYDGLNGVAYVLDRLGRHAEALKVLGICIEELDGKWRRFGLDLYGGLAGMGLNLAHFAATTGDASLWDVTWRVAEVVADRLGDEDSVSEISGGSHPYAGLVRGASGPALLFIRLFERAGDPALLDLAATALRQDLRRCYRRDDGSLEVNEGWRTMPYLADGSVGIGVVLEDYLAHRQDEQFLEASTSIRRAADAQFYIEPGLFYGRAGMMLYLSRAFPPGTAGRDPAVGAHMRRLSWHAMSYKDHLAFPGEQLLRLSMDLGSGTAGVLLALGSALHDECVNLPFLEPPRSVHGRADAVGDTAQTCTTERDGRR